jgi:hypothetical protein
MPQNNKNTILLLFQMVKLPHRSNILETTVSYKPQSSLELGTVFRIRLITLR